MVDKRADDDGNVYNRSHRGSVLVAVRLLRNAVVRGVKGLGEVQPGREGAGDVERRVAVFLVALRRGLKGRWV